MPRRPAITLAGLGLFALLAVAAHLTVGDAAGGVHWPETAEIFRLRLHRVEIALVVGASLAVAGVLLQALLRNPLASPDLIGVTSGAGLGVAAASYAGVTAGGALIATPAGQTVAALAGALATLGIVLAWTVRRGGIDVISLVLVGVIIGMTCAGLTMLLHHLMPDGGFAARAWLLGSIDEGLPGSMVLLAAVLLGGCLALSLAVSRSIDAATLGEDEARSLGVRLARLRLVLFLSAGVLTSISVVLAGPIGFVGLIVPHATRMLVGPHHAVLLVGAAVCGGGVVVAADAAITAMPLAFGGGRLPLGVITAIIGGPLFLLLLRSTLSSRAL